MKITASVAPLLGVCAVAFATPASAMGPILGFAEKSSPVHDNARRLAGDVTVAFFDFESGDQGWTADFEARIRCNDVIPATDHWSLGTTLPGTIGVDLGSTWWTNPNDGTQGGTDRSYVTSPPLTAACTTPSITFDSYSSNWGGYIEPQEYVQLSVNDGAFTPYAYIQGYDVTGLNEKICDQEFRTITITFTTNIAVSDTLRYRFLYDACSSYGAFLDGCYFFSEGADITGWAFDNVRITCPESTPCPDNGDDNTVDSNSNGIPDCFETPVALCQNLSLSAGTECMATAEAGDVDNGSYDYQGDELSLSLSPSGPFSNGDVVTLTVNDGQATDSCQATITVIDKAICQDVTVDVSNGPVTIKASDINNGSNDFCGVVSLNLDKTEFGCGNVGGDENTVTLTIRDNNGNDNTCTATVTVINKAVCQDVTVDVSSGPVTIEASDIDNGSNDFCGAVSLNLDKTVFTCDDVGGDENTVTLTIRDSNGNNNTCDATVTVINKAVCQDVDILLLSSGPVTIAAEYIDNGSSDACGISSMSLSKTEFGCVDVGDNTLTLTVADSNGNNNTCTATVTVKTTPTAVCQNVDILLSSSGSTTITAEDIDNGSSDACGISSMSLDKTVYDCADVGENTVNLTVADNNGNNNTGTTPVTVYDTTLPTAVCQNVTVDVSSGSGTITVEDIDSGSNDFCGISSMSLDKTVYDCADVGENTVNLLVTDNSGNAATCTATVTVYDTTAPTAFCQDVDILLSPNGGSTFITAEYINNGSSDDCSSVSLKLDITDFDCADVGDNTVTLSVDDGSANSDTCTATVTVYDKTPPTAVCQDVTIDVSSGSGTVAASEIDNESSDGCGISSRSLDKTVFTCDDIGPENVELTVEDASGNVAYCSATVTVEGSCDSTAGNSGANGDPHFKTWRGQHYDFHGECDLVLLHNAEFESGSGLDVHIRTKIRRDMAYISSAALRIGKDVLEVESQGVYWLNSVQNADLPDEFSGFAFSHTQPTDKQHVFEIHLGGRERIKLKTYKDLVSVLIEQGKSEHFHHSVGLMGDFRMGQMIARDGKTVIDDANAFGQQWQVLDTEPSLFQTVRLPQHPQVCTMPTPVQADHLRRRLAETSSADEAAAEKACEHWGKGKDDCVFDVLATGDLEMAMVGAY
jgi:hypothetical protein